MRVFGGLAGLAGLLATLVSLPLVAAPHKSVAPPSYAELAAKGAQAVLENADDIHFGYDTQDVTSSLMIHEPGKDEPREMRCRMRQSGDKRLIQILYPPEAAGMSILIKDEDTMYVYMPEFDKVRRVASHARRQTFLGSDFSYDDMGMGRLSPDYTAEFDKERETADTAVLDLTARAGRTPGYPKLRLYIDKKTTFATKQEYFDEDGKLVRTQVRSGMKSFDDPSYAVQHVITMTDHTNHDHHTVLTMTAFKAMHEIPNRLFSKRTLIRGE